MKAAVRMVCLITIIGSAIVLPVGSVFAQQSLILPAKMVFTTFTEIFPLGAKPRSPAVIEQVDTQTEKVSVFYANPFGDAFAMAWSPSGKSLAVVLAGHIDQTDKIVLSDGPNDGEAHVCILDRAGLLQRCMKQVVSDSLGVSGKGDGLYTNYMPVTWSTDEQKLYFMTGFLPDKLLESDAQTGQTVRIIYNKSDMDPDTVTWSPNADYLILSAKDTTASDSAPLVHFSATGQEVSRIELVQPLAIPAGAVSPTIATPDQPHARVPCSFSPRGTYFTTIDSGDPPPYESDIVDMTGTVRYRLVNTSPRATVPYYCPDWKSDESALYFTPYHDYRTGDSWLIYQYTLSTGKVEPYYSQPNTLPEINSPFSVSPDGKYLAYETLDNPAYATAFEVPNGTYTLSRVVIVGPNNAGPVFFSGPGYVGERPLWVPPLQP